MSSKQKKSQGSPDKKIIKSSVTKQEYDIIVAQAKKENLTTSEHIRRKVLDKSKGKNQIVDGITKRMPIFRNYVNEIEDENLKQRFSEWGNDIWQYIK